MAGELSEHVYNLQELEDAARELAAMRLATNADWVRHLHSLDDDDLVSEFDGRIQHELMEKPLMGREPDTHRLTPMFALSLLMQAVWDHEKALLQTE